MRINDLFDKIYLINMDKDKDRLEHMLNRFKEWSIEDYQRIQGGGYLQRFQKVFVVIFLMTHLDML